MESIELKRGLSFAEESVIPTLDNIDNKPYEDKQTTKKTSRRAWLLFRSKLGSTETVCEHVTYCMNNLGIMGIL